MEAGPHRRRRLAPFCRGRREPSVDGHAEAVRLGLVVPCRKRCCSRCRPSWRRVWRRREHAVAGMVGRWFTVDERTRRFALAAGAVGMLANLLLIGFYALELGREPIAGVSLGSLNDLTGAVGTALMIPVALAFGPAWLRALGITAMTVGTVGGLLLVFDVLTFEQQLPIVLAAFVALALWMLLTARQLTGARRRLGVAAAAGVLVGMPVVGLG